MPKVIRHVLVPLVMAIRKVKLVGPVQIPVDPRKLVVVPIQAVGRVHIVRRGRQRATTFGSGKKLSSLAATGFTGILLPAYG